VFTFQISSCNKKFKHYSNLTAFIILNLEAIKLGIKDAVTAAAKAVNETIK
jgi:hypothetical protein